MALEPQHHTPSVRRSTERESLRSSAKRSPNALSRGGWSLRTETFTSMSSDAQTFRLTGRIEAYEGDILVFERDFIEHIPRRFI